MSRRSSGVVEGAVGKLKHEQDEVFIPQAGLNSIIVSDSVVLWVVPDAEDTDSRIKALRFLLHAVQVIQFQCALENIWLRGGVSFGAAMYSESNIAGPGFLQAYNLETLATYPRVLVDARMMKDLFPHLSADQQVATINASSDLSKYSGRYLYEFRSATTGPFFKNDYFFFVNFLHHAFVSEGKEDFKKIWSHIQRNVYDTDPRIMEKHRWISEYIVHTDQAEVYSGARTSTFGQHISKFPI